jgi:hypothetical protein
MENTDKTAGMRKAGLTRLMILTPPNTIKQSTTVRMTPYTCRSCKFGLFRTSGTPDGEGATYRSVTVPRTHITAQHSRSDKVSLLGDYRKAIRVLLCIIL